MSNIKAITTKPMPSQTPEIDAFFTEVALNAKKANRTRFVVLSLNNNEGDMYQHSLSTLGLKTSEAVALLDIAKDALIKSMT